METPVPHAQPWTVLRLNLQAPYYKWLVAGIVLLAEGSKTFAGNSVNLAIPHLMATFGTDLATTQWITTGFLFARTLVMPLLGWLGGVIGHRNLFVITMIGFVMTAIGCGLATNISMLISFRLLQGVMVGPTDGLAAVLLVQVFPPRQRGLALGLRSLGWAVGHVTSFTLGGYFIEQLSWRLFFILGVPTGLLAAVLGLLMLPQQREERDAPVDYPGLVVLAGFLVPLLLVISLGRNSETAMSTLMLLGLGALVGGGLFVLWELLTPFPVVNLRLFRVPAFGWTCATEFLTSMGLMGAQFMVPIFLQQVMGFTPLQAGLIIMPALIISGLSGVVTGRLSDLVAPPLVVMGGVVALTGIFYSFTGFSAATTVGVLVGSIILYRICMYAINIPLAALTVEVLEENQVRMGQGLVGVIRGIGGSLGVTVISVFFERRRVVHQLLAYDTYDSTSPVHGATLRGLKRFLHEGGLVDSVVDQAALRTIRRQMDVEAIALGFRESFVLIGVCFLLASLPMVGLLRQRWRPRANDSTG